MVLPCHPHGHSPGTLRYTFVCDSSICGGKVKFFEKSFPFGEKLGVKNLRSRGSPETDPDARGCLRSSPLALGALHIHSGTMGPYPPATATALSLTRCYAMDLLKQASSSSPAVTLRPTHPSTTSVQMAWSTSSFACFSFGEGMSGLLGAGPACYGGHRPSPP